MKGMRRVKESVSTGFVPILRTLDHGQELVIEEQFKNVWIWITIKEFKERKLKAKRFKEEWQNHLKAAFTRHKTAFGEVVSANNNLLNKLKQHRPSL